MDVLGPQDWGPVYQKPDVHVMYVDLDGWNPF